MKHDRHNASINLTKTSNHRLEDLFKASELGEPQGPLNIVVSLFKGKELDTTVKEARKAIGTPSESEFYFSLEGDIVYADDADIEDSAEIDTKLADDIGWVGSKDKGRDCDLLYVINHDGLPLIYNKAYRDYFKTEQSGRASVSKATDLLMTATSWLVSTNMPHYLELISAAKGDAASLKTSIVHEWKAAGSPPFVAKAG